MVGLLPCTVKVPPKQLNCTASGPVAAMLCWSISKTRSVSRSIRTAMGGSEPLLTKQAFILTYLRWQRLSSSRSFVVVEGDFLPLNR